MQQIGGSRFPDEDLLIVAIVVNLIFISALVFAAILSYRNGIQEVKLSSEHENKAEEPA